ncbi:globin family protein [Pseudanabaena mucicola]|uniref:Phycocyanin n=1 Tax=Pseudanabaena mucicola FACHB-723 TaxID=2692860 RepID=A0ABR8A1N4_9CYAN|nr:phycocyanin [Pseudanabaena mucicola]MBD2190157.1 phycocyanin [Pseudanabaena mucicola FACHB-723]
MLTMNRTLDEKVADVDHIYLSDSDIFNLERFANNFSVRVKTYNLLRDRADEITVKTLNLLSQQYPELVNKQLQRCKYDMSNTMRYTALSVLRDDELFFRETLMDWLANIINSYQVAKECSTAYRLMQSVIDEMLPAECAALVKPYSDMAISALLHA